MLGQHCPQTALSGASVPSEIVILEGKLVFHDDIRKWFELLLDQPQCGDDSVQVVRGGNDWTPLQVLRACRVRSKGVIDFSQTGYFSSSIHQTVDEIEQIGSCTRQLPFPDYSQAKPDKSVREYRVDMHIDYEPGDHPIIFRVTSAGKELRPWQAYASYWLTGLFVLYGHCAEGFVIDKVFGTPQAKPSHFHEARTSGDMATFDPESAAASGKRHLRLGYTCVRE